MYPKGQRDAEKWVGSEDYCLDSVANVMLKYTFFVKGLLLFWINMYALF